jgi:hypothetical protein
MKETIFYLEGRGGMYLFHFFIYNLAGLYYITNGIYNKRSNDSILFDDKTKLVNIPTNISNPIKIHMKNIIPFQREAFEIIKDKFELIDEAIYLKIAFPNLPRILNLTIIIYIIYYILCLVYVSQQLIDLIYF